MNNRKETKTELTEKINNYLENDFETLNSYQDQKQEIKEIISLTIKKTKIKDKRLTLLLDHINKKGDYIKSIITLFLEYDAPGYTEWWFRNYENLL